MTGSPGDRPVPELIVADSRGDAVFALTIVPMVEVPSGTSGPWIGLANELSPESRAVARGALWQAMQHDSVAGVLDAVDESGEAIAWRLTNTAVAVSGGGVLYFSPKTVCWCDAEGNPRYECDEWLAPAESMDDPDERLRGDYVVVSD